MPTLGEELRQAREKRGISLRQIADATHIGVRFLQAIEEDDYKILPGGIFNRAFVKSFAKYIGVDEQYALDLYQQKLNEQGGEPPKTPALPLEGIEDNEPSSWTSTFLWAIGLIILGLGVIGAYRYLKSSEEQTPIVGVASPSPTSSLAVVPVSPTPTPAASPTVSPATSPGASPTVSPGAPSPAASGSPGIAPSPGASPAVPAPPLTGALQLKIQAKDGECWVKVKTDAKPNGEMALLKPGESREFASNDRLVVNVGNVMTMDAFLNGRPAKFAPNRGKVSLESLIITKENYSQFVQ